MFQLGVWESTVEQTNLVYSFFDALYTWASVLHKPTMNHLDTEFDYGNTSLVEMTVDQFFNLAYDGVLV